jgi:hypothetical protein
VPKLRFYRWDAVARNLKISSSRRDLIERPRGLTEVVCSCSRVLVLVVFISERTDSNEGEHQRKVASSSVLMNSASRYRWILNVFPALTGLTVRL